MTEKVIFSMGNIPAGTIVVSGSVASTFAGLSNVWNLTSSSNLSNIKIGDKLELSGNSYLVLSLTANSINVSGEVFSNLVAATVGTYTHSRGVGSLQQFANICNLFNLVQKQLILECQVYKEGPGANNEWTINATSNFYLTSNCDVDNYVVIKAAPGESFIDRLKTENLPIKYNPKYGVAFLYGNNNYLNAIGCGSQSAQNKFPKLIIEGLMLKGVAGYNATTTYVVSGSPPSFKNKIIVRNVISEGHRFRNEALIVNSVLYSGSGALALGHSAYVELVNCTIVRTNNASSIFTATDFNSLRLRNSVFIKYSDQGALDNAFIEADCRSNATDMPKLGPASIPGCIYNIDPNTQFENTSVGSENFALKIGSVLIGAGTPDAVYTNNLDISGRPRSLTNPSIGAIESVWYSFSPVVQQSDQTISKGIARGIERGIV